MILLIGIIIGGAVISGILTVIITIKDGRESQGSGRPWDQY
jgi:hypothetical protein